MNQKKDKRITYLRIGISIFVCFWLILIGCMFIKNNSIVGRWRLDNVTVYDFRNSNEGTLVLPSKEYEFIYKVKDNVLYIDFLSENAKDASYTFQINGDTLTLEGGNITTKGVYVLKKFK